MKNKILKITMLVLGILATMLTIRFELSVLECNPLYIIIHRVKEWAFIVFLWVSLMTILLYLLLNDDHNKKDRK